MAESMAARPAVCANCNRLRDGTDDGCACSDAERAEWDDVTED